MYCARLFICALGVAFAFGSTQCLAQDEPGASVFQTKCASCHGANGQGVADGYEEPLYGDHSIAVLARLIERTMPEEEPEACVGDEARQVAEYIYHEFYSPEARQQKGLITPAPNSRVELVRLTVPQYRNTVADLIGHFTPTPDSDPRREEKEPQDDAALTSPEPGLRAEYFRSKGMSKADELVQERVDRSIDFDYGENGPLDGITADQFAIIWQGALAARDTGHYEFRVRTQNGARLYLNVDHIEHRRKLRDDSAVAGQSALIDAWVSSGKIHEHSARVFLLGGRQYPLRLEFFKYKEPAASIRLEWKSPHSTWSVLDRNHLSTARVARTFVADVPFPADDRSLGYERGSSVSRRWHAAATAAAIATAAEVVNRLPLLANLNGEDPDRSEHVKAFVARFANVAFRRPLSDAEDQWLREVPFADAPNSEAAVRRAILVILNSPHFLYTDLTPVGQAPPQHAIASKLSFALWDSIPDRRLLDAAANGQLTTVEQIAAQAERMMADRRTRAKMRDFFHQWLELEERDLDKDDQMFPEFDEAVVADLRASLELFVERVVWSEASDYRQLLLANYLILNERLRGLYQPHGEDGSASTHAAEAAKADPVTEANPAVESDALVEPDSFADSAPTDLLGSDFKQVTFPRRAGVLTHPYLLSAFAYHNTTSPIHRGVFLTRNIVGRSLNPPPVAVAFKNDEFAPDLTMREKITQLTRDQACMSCHSVINPLGFALENYDAVGRWRTNDNNKPVDPKGKYMTVDGECLEVQSARDISNFAVISQSAHRAFITQVFHHLVKQDPTAYGPRVVDQLRAQFAADNFNIQHLVARIAVVAATHGRTATLPESEL